MGASGRSAARGRRGTLCAALLVALCTAGCGAPGTPGEDATPGVFEVRMTGEDYRWKIRYPGSDGRFDTADDVETTGDLHLPAGRRVTLDLRSEDYLYTLALPHLGLKEIAVPDLSFRMEFETPDVGMFDLLGDQMCGYDHPGLLIRLQVHPSAEFERWIRSRS